MVAQMPSECPNRRITRSLAHFPKSVQIDICTDLLHLVLKIGCLQAQFTPSFYSPIQFLSLLHSFPFPCIMDFEWVAILRRVYARDASWSRRDESGRPPLSFAAGPFLLNSCFWVDCTVRSVLHWIVPLYSGVLFEDQVLLFSKV